MLLLLSQIQIVIKGFEMNESKKAKLEELITLWDKSEIKNSQLTRLVGLLLEERGLK